MYKILLSFLFVSMMLISSNIFSDTFRSRQTTLLDSTLIFSLDSLVAGTSEQGTVNVSNIAQFLNTNPAVTQISVSFTGAIAVPVGYNNRYIQVTTEINNAVNFLYRKYNSEITGSHYFTANLSSGNFNLAFYIKNYVNNTPYGFVKLYNIRVRRLF